MYNNRVLLTSRFHLLYIACFETFYPRIIKANIHNFFIEISNFQNGLNDLFSLTGLYFKSKVIEGSHKGKVMFLNFWALFPK